MIRSVAVAAPAKINLRLVVLARETSGYHSLETIFAGISLADEIIIRRGDAGLRLEVTGGIDTGPDESNLVTRAARSFFQAAGISPDVTIILQKAVPAQAGLGGGSSDAAATLRGLNELFGGPLTIELLSRLGANLGSDVPFFLAPTPFAVGWGHGERLLSLMPPPSREVLVAHPGVAIPTAAAFQRFAEMQAGNYPVVANVVTAGSLSDWQSLSGLAVNDLYPPALEKVPGLEQARQLMLSAGANISLLSGSGSALFGVFKPGTDLAPTVARLSSLGYQSWRAQTLTDWPSTVKRD